MLLTIDFMFITLLRFLIELNKFVSSTENFMFANGKKGLILEFFYNKI